ncbi:MAG TPA: hypothetical protein VMM92_07040 [Thermoanaerobaculia bacterium]|nr:hypothetical protein [Thermoanaerobaculia bacterium]
MRIERLFLPALAALLVLPLPGCRKEGPRASAPSSPSPDSPARGQSAAAHLALAGSYRAEASARAYCALFADGTFQVSFNAAGAPQVVLRVEHYHGAGDYQAEARVRANYSGEGVRQSRGPVQATLTASGGSPRPLNSGSFSGTFKGEGGAGEVRGSFERCPYDPQPSRSLEGAP